MGTPIEEVKVDIEQISGEMSVPSNNQDATFDFNSISGIRGIANPIQLFGYIRRSLRPWTEFFNTANFKTAASMPRLTARFVRNIGYFQSNYICIGVVLMIYCLVTSPLILLVLVASSYISYRINKANTSVTLFGYQISAKHQILAANCAAVPILFLAGAGAALFWTLGASCFVISLHAIFYNIEAIVTEESEGFLAEVV